MIFKLWDEDMSGYIDLFNIVALAEDLGKPMTNERGKEIIRLTSETDKISFEEFENLMIRPEPAP
jgi:Ca2+-binding EF-hand superfamily protein